jgi:hypothetical protein
MTALSLNHLRSLAVLAVLLISSFALAKKDDQGNKVKDTKDKQDQPQAEGKGDQPKVKLSSEQRWLLNIREQLKVSDPEWEVLAPRIETVIRLQREFGSGHDPRGPREPKPPKVSSPEDPAKPTPEVLAKARELSATLFDQGAPNSDVKMKVAAIREARARVRKQLTIRKPC